MGTDRAWEHILTVPNDCMEWDRQTPLRKFRRTAVILRPVQLDV
jgi:hypothetical protein